MASAQRATSALPAGNAAVTDVTPLGPSAASSLAELKPSRPLAAVTGFAQRVGARTTRPAATATVRADAGGLPVRRRSTRTVAQQCEDHVAVLYARAYLQLGDRTAAEDAVLTAVARAAGLPATPDGVTVSVWHVLAAHLHDQSELICVPHGGVGPFSERHGRGRVERGATGAVMPLATAPPDTPSTPPPQSLSERATCTTR